VKPVTIVGIVWVLIVCFIGAGVGQAEEGRRRIGAQITLVYPSVWASLWETYVDGEQYMSIHEVPWDSFTVQEKMFLCAFGSPGNKMDVDEFQEAMLLFGTEEVVRFANLAKEVSR